MAVTCLPYVVVWWFTPLDGVFPWTLFGADDQGVYYSWIRQARDGSLVFRNLFTTEEQRGVSFNAYFLLLGWLSRLPGLDVPLAAHLGRVVGGVATLALAYRLAAGFTTEVFARRCVFWVTAVGSGLGWLFWRDAIGQREPADVWQPETLVPLSLYTNGLFAASLALMLGFVICLLRAEEPERGGARWAVAGGLCLMALGNIHSYDVIHLALVWALYLAVRFARPPRPPLRLVGYAALAGLVALPPVAYMAWLYVAEPVFRARADVPTRSGPLSQYLLGFGLLLPLAGWGAARLRRAGERVLHGPALPAAWAVGGLAAAYLPFAFQRKMIMGAGVAVALLAGIGVAWLAERAAARCRAPRWLFAVGLLAAVSPSTLRFLERDVRLARERNMVSTQVHPAYWPLSDIRAFEWFGQHAPRDAALLTFPLNGVLVPGYSGRRVYAGHFGETPGFEHRVPEVRSFYRGDSGRRREFLHRHGITHVLWGPMERAAARAALPGGAPPLPLDGEPFLRPVFTEGETTLYAVTF